MLFFFSFEGKFFVSALFCSDLENRAGRWCLGDWVDFFLGGRRGLCILYDVIYSLGEGTLGKNMPMPGYVLSMIWEWKWYENIWAAAVFLSILEAATVALAYQGSLCAPTILPIGLTTERTPIQTAKPHCASWAFVCLVYVMIYKSGGLCLLHFDKNIWTHVIIVAIATSCLVDPGHCWHVHPQIIFDRTAH